MSIFGKKSLTAKLKEKISKSSSKISGGIADIFHKKPISNETLDELEELLITSDVGTLATQKIIDNLRKNKFHKEISEEEIKRFLAEEISKILLPMEEELKIDNSKKPQVIIIMGVNGVGKTTTIGKMAKQIKNDGKKVMIAACDTFRAAATEQLEIWAKRAECEIITAVKEGEDPASVAYRALQKAKNDKADVLLIDTAGRLQNKRNLMEELSKISRVLKKIDDTAPHNNLLVLDATVGQNAHSQLAAFNDIAKVSGLIITKLDGTAKGGIIISLADKFAVPIHAIGVGESVDDLRKFKAKEFAESLVGLE